MKSFVGILLLEFFFEKYFYYISFYFKQFSFEWFKKHIISEVLDVRILFQTKTVLDNVSVGLILDFKGSVREK